MASRRQGAYAVWYPSDLPEIIRGAILRVEDMTLVMQRLAGASAVEVQDRLAHGGDGEYPWPPLDSDTLERKARAGAPNRPGIGVHGGFGPTIRQFFGPKNFGWMTRAPHAHLFTAGTQRHFVHGQRVSAYSVNRRHRSRGETRRILASASHGESQPARPFNYLSQQLKTLAMQRIVDFVISNELEGLNAS